MCVSEEEMGDAYVCPCVWCGSWR